MRLDTATTLSQDLRVRSETIPAISGKALNGGLTPRLLAHAIESSRYRLENRQRAALKLAYESSLCPLR